MRRLFHHPLYSSSLAVVVLGVLVATGSVGCSDDDASADAGPSADATADASQDRPDASDDDASADAGPSADATADASQDRPDASGDDVGGQDAALPSDTDRNDATPDANQPDEPDASGNDVGGQDGDTDQTMVFNSSIDDATEISELSEDDQKTVCAEAGDFDLEVLTDEQYCLYLAHLSTAFEQPSSDSQAQQACQDTRQTCLSTQQDLTPTCDEISGAASCSVTVGDWQRCETALVGTLGDHIDELPACSDVTVDFYDPSIGSDPTDCSAPAACTQLKSNCSVFYTNVVGPIKGGDICAN